MQEGRVPRQMSPFVISCCLALREKVILLLDLQICQVTVSFGRGIKNSIVRLVCNENLKCTGSATTQRPPGLIILQTLRQISPKALYKQTLYAHLNKGLASAARPGFWTASRVERCEETGLFLNGSVSNNYAVSSAEGPGKCLLHLLLPQH